MTTQLRRFAPLAVAIGTLVAIGVSGWGELEWHAPTYQDVRAAHRPSDTRLEARDGRLLHEIRIDPTRRVLPWTPLGEISPALVDAVLRSEDRRFHEHPGVDVRALAAAAWQRTTTSTRRGGSTISMQLTALLDPRLRAGAGGRTWEQKARQIRAAIELERTWRKEQILEAYLNLVPFRGEVEGVTAAAGVLLAKSPHGLDNAEAALLAALLRAPSAPPDVVTERARRLNEESLEEDQLARATDAIFAPPNRRPPTTRLAPHLARRSRARAYRNGFSVDPA